MSQGDARGPHARGRPADADRYRRAAGRARDRCRGGGQGLRHGPESRQRARQLAELVPASAAAAASGDLRPGSRRRRGRGRRAGRRHRARRSRLCQPGPLMRLLPVLPRRASGRSAAISPSTAISASSRNRRAMYDMYPHGGFCEYMAAPQYAIVKLPDNVSFHEAARLGYLGHRLFRDQEGRPDRRQVHADQRHFRHARDRRDAVRARHGRRRGFSAPVATATCSSA